jgi:hypothetical protein
VGRLIVWVVLVAGCGRLGFDTTAGDDTRPVDADVSADARADDAGPTGYTDFADATAWATFDTTTVAAGAAGFAGSIFDGRYLYLAPAYNGTVNGLVVRHDTQGAFTDGAAWSAFDTTTVHTNSRGFKSGVFDGRYVYLAPNELTGGMYGGAVTRYDTTQPFAQMTSWSTFDTTSLTTRARGFYGARFDGRYIYFVPYYDSVLVRYDTQGVFDTAAAWTTVDVGTMLSIAGVGFIGGVLDGRYLYLVPFVDGAAPTGVVARYDTQGPLTSASSWAKFDTTSVTPHAKGFATGGFDGRYLYLSPFFIAGGMANGTMTRFDTTAPFTAAASWSTFDISTLDATAKGYFGATYDGRYLYFAPYNNKAIARYDTSASFGDAAAWGIYDATVHATAARDFYGTAFDGDDVYFIPHGSSTVVRFHAKSPPALPVLPSFGGSFF